MADTARRRRKRVCPDRPLRLVVLWLHRQTEYKSPKIGKQIVIGMTPAEDGACKGKGLRPAADRICSGSAQVSGQSLTLKGCVGGGLICKSQTWTRPK